ncbi:MAG: acetyltransferase [Planctomycetota bacterium]
MDGEGRQLLILGLGGQATVVSAIARALGYSIMGFLDAFHEPQPGIEVAGRRVLGGISSLARMTAPLVAVAVGDNRLRCDVVCKVLAANPGASPVSLVHPRSFREDDVTLGAHVTVCIGSIIGARATLADGVIVNSGAVVDHECVLERYCHVGPGARLAGRVRVGEFAQVGIGATVIEKITIGKSAVIGAGAVVIDNIPDGATAAGVPARVIKTRSPGA